MLLNMRNMFDVRTVSLPGKHGLLIGATDEYSKEAVTVLPENLLDYYCFSKLLPAMIG